MGVETGSTMTASATTQSLTTGDFPMVSRKVRFIGLILVIVAGLESLWRDGLQDVGGNPAKVSG